MKNKLLLLLTIITFFLLTACSKKTDTNQSVNDYNDLTITDNVGRTIQPPESISKGIVTLGSAGPLRFLSIFDEFENVIALDRGDVTDNRNGRAYSYAYPYYSLDLSMTHPDKKAESATVEKIAAKHPKLILVQRSVYDSYKVNCDFLGSQFPLVVLPEQELTHLWDENYKLTEWYKEAVIDVGKAVGKQKQSEKHIENVNTIIEDIRSYIGNNNKKSYVAGICYHGTNELNSTFPVYLPLELIEGINTHTETKYPRVEIDPENISQLDMNYFFIDPTSVEKLATPNSQFILNWLFRQNNDGNPKTDVQIFSVLPITWDNANYDCILADSYYLAHILYNTLNYEETIDKINNIFTTYYGEHGKNVLSDMQDFFRKKSKAFGAEIVPLNELKVIKKDGKFTLKIK